MKPATLCRSLLFVVSTVPFLSVAGVAIAQTTSVTVSDAVELESAVANANSAGGKRTILLRDGTYMLSDTLYVNAPNVTIAGLSGNRRNVIITGDAMSSSARIGNVIRVAASFISLNHNFIVLRTRIEARQ